MSVEPSAKQIGKALLAYAEEHMEWDSYGQYINYYGDQRGIVYDIPGIGEVKIVDYHNYDVNKNYDGWYEDIWIVFDVGGKLYKAKGIHSSYEMSEWAEELKLVEPKQKLVTFYEDVE